MVKNRKGNGGWGKGGGEESGRLMKKGVGGGLHQKEEKRVCFRDYNLRVTMLHHPLKASKAPSLMLVTEDAIAGLTAQTPHVPTPLPVGAMRLLRFMCASIYIFIQYSVCVSARERGIMGRGGFTTNMCNHATHCSEHAARVTRVRSHALPSSRAARTLNVSMFFWREMRWRGGERREKRDFPS